MTGGRFGMVRPFQQCFKLVHHLGWYYYCTLLVRSEKLPKLRN
jgi:hypothetical protein